MDILKINPNPEAPPAETPKEPATSDAGAVVSDPLNTLKLKPQVIEVVSTVYDPEIPVNIYELGLIYDITVNAAGVVGVRMTLTSPMCPAAQSLPVEVSDRVKAIPGVTGANVEVVWDPPWDKDKMSEAAKLQLGLL